MGIITLTTDLGEKDHYVASLKASVLGACPDAVLIDVSHQISAFNKIEASFVLKSAFPKFPKGTVHLVGVDPDAGPGQAAIAMELKGHYFVGPDNGILSMIRNGRESRTVKINPELSLNNEKSHSFDVQNLYAPVAGMLSRGESLDEIGEDTEIREFKWGAPSYIDNALRGSIIYLDNFGNAITNIQKEEFLHIRDGRSFQIFVRRARIKRIVNNYSDVPTGIELAIFNDSGHLEISIRQGSAAALMGLKEQDMLTIEFYE